MEIALILIGITFIGLSVYLVFKLIKWIAEKRKRKAVALVIVSVGIIILTVNHFFFKKMHFIQSKVYNNLYLIKYPEKDQNILQQAIREKIKEHLNTSHKTGKKLAYTGDNGIFFYEYHKHFPFALFQDAGTYYFIEHEEDLGGFVSEELGMYTEYRLAEFYFEPCKADATLYCGELDYFVEGEFVKADTLKNLDFKKFDLQ